MHRSSDWLGRFSPKSPVMCNVIGAKRLVGKTIFAPVKWSAGKIVSKITCNVLSSLLNSAVTKSWWMNGWMEPVCYVARLRWNLTSSTIRSVTSVPASTAAESSRRSSVPTWPACSITASRAGHEFTRRRAVSSTNRWWRREPTGRVQCRSVGVETMCSLRRLRRFGSAVVCLPSVACRVYKSNNVGFIIVVLLLCFCVLFQRLAVA